MNKVILIGRLVRDPELRFTKNGKAVATFSIAVNRTFSKEKEADFFNIIVWGVIAEACANYLAKGRLVGIEGRLQTRTYIKDDEKRYITEVVAEQVEFLEWGNKESKSQAKKDNDLGSVDIDMSEFHAMADDEDIPF